MVFKNISNFGQVLNNTEQKKINGGSDDDGGICPPCPEGLTSSTSFFICC